MTISRPWTPELASQWIDEQLDKKKKSYIQSGKPQHVSFRTWCKDWEWARRSDVFTHLIHSYPAKLLAYVPISFLTSSLVARDEIVLDSFAGTGTVMLECLVHKYYPRRCYGTDINPIARLIAKVKTTPINNDILSNAAVALSKSIASTPHAPIPDFEGRDFWFRRGAQRGLARIVHCIEALDQSADVKDFFRVCLSAIIRDMSRADPDVAPPVLLNVENFPADRLEQVQRVAERKKKADAAVLFKRKVADNLARMQELTETVGLLPEAPARVIWDDGSAIRLGKYVEAGRIDKSNATTMDESVAMIITSPPYMAAQKYIRTTKLEMSWLGLATNPELRALERTIIGTERIPMQEQHDYIPVGNQTADTLLQKVFKKNPERAAIGSRYYRDMRRSLGAMHAVLKPGGICVLVVGNNTISGHTASNHDILGEIAAEDSMFSIEIVLKDTILSRGLMTKRHETADVIDDEYVVVLRKRTV